jgi:hypothetical protein
MILGCGGAIAAQGTSAGALLEVALSLLWGALVIWT